MHIAVAGNIGSGKTTLTGLLAKHYGWEPHFESVEFNPYLVDFYNDMRRWSFNLQVYFLNKRLKDIVEFQNSGKNVIQDRTIYEDAMIFAPNLHDMGLREQHPHRLPQGPQRPLRAVDLRVQGRTAHHRRGYLPFRGPQGGLQSGLRPDRRQAVRTFQVT